MELVLIVDALCFIIFFVWVIIVFELFQQSMVLVIPLLDWHFTHYSLNKFRIVMNFFPLFGGSYYGGILDCQACTWATHPFIDIYSFSNSMLSLLNESSKFECWRVGNPYPFPSNTCWLKFENTCYVVNPNNSLNIFFSQSTNLSHCSSTSLLM